MRGTVWWGIIGSASVISARRLEQLRRQVTQQVPTYAFLYRTASPPSEALVARARILALTIDPADVDDDLIPDYYPKADCKLFLRLAGLLPSNRVGS